MNLEDFTAQLKQLAKRIDSTREAIQTEEATKMSFILPLFQLLGFDVFNPTEFVPEFSADVGIKKGEKVDYAIIVSGEPVILIEAKWCGEKLEKHDSQLFRYFGTTKAKFGILTNGIVYRFYTDLDVANRMDEKPFLEINLLELKESHIFELRKFSKDKFDVVTILTSASELKYLNMMRQKLVDEFNNPSDAFVKILIADLYEGVKTQKVVDEFKSIVKKSFTQYVNETINDRLKNALDAERTGVTAAAEAAAAAEPSTTFDEPATTIITTEDEMQCFYIIKSTLSGIVALDRVTYKDTETYFGIMLDNNTRKWVCRLRLGDKKKTLMLPGENNTMQSFPLQSLDDLYTFKEQIIASASRF